MSKKDFYNWWVKNGSKGRDKAYKLFKEQNYPVKNINYCDVESYVREFKGIQEVSPKILQEKKEKPKPKERAFTEPELQITHLKNQIKIKESEVRTLQNIAASDLAIVKLFENAIDKFKPNPIILSRSKNKIDDEEIVSLLSDIHYGEVVSSEAMMDFNSYDTSIAEKRLNIWYNNIKIILNKLNSCNVKKINLMMLGDMVNGNIHEELKSGTCEVDQVINLAEIIAQIIMDLSKDFELVVSGVIGNHGRMTKKPSFKKKYNNFDYLVYKFIETRCQNLNNVEFLFPKAGMLLQKIQNHNFLLRHGDSKIQSYAGIPFYGIQRASNKITQTMAYFKDVFINYEVLGHFHTTNTLEKAGGSIIMNGCIKGGDEYALEAMMTGSEAKQTIFGVHKEYGKTWTYDVHCM